MSENVPKSALCRLCANEIEENDYTYIFSPENSGFCEKLNECLPIFIKNTDGLPKQICLACLEMFSLYHNFFFQVLNADRKLITKLHRAKVMGREASECVACPLCVQGSMDVKDGRLVLGPEQNPTGLVVLDNECITKMIEKELRLQAAKYEIKSEVEPRENEVVAYSCFSCNAEFQSEMEIAAHDCSKETQRERVKKPKRPKRLKREPEEEEEEPMQCDRCGRCCKSYRKLVMHINNSHSPKRHYCSICQEMFSKKALLKKHLREHTGEKPYKCDECGKEFTAHTTLRSHINFTHAELISLQCSECQATGFYSKQDLENHIRTKHTKERKFKCNVCSKSFMSSGVYYQHRAIHTNIRKHKCQECGKGFRRWETLHNHIRTHTGEKPYKCDVCGRGFRQRGDMRKHRVTQHFDVVQIEENVSAQALLDGVEQYA